MTTTTTITSQTGGSAGRAATPAVPSVTLRCVSGAPVVRGNHALDGVQRHKMPAGRGGGTVCGRSSRHAGRRDRDAAVCGGQVAGPGGVQLFHQRGCGGHGRQQLVCDARRQTCGYLPGRKDGSSSPIHHTAATDDRQEFSWRQFFPLDTFPYSQLAVFRSFVSC